MRAVVGLGNEIQSRDGVGSGSRTIWAWVSSGVEIQEQWFELGLNSVWLSVRSSVMVLSQSMENGRTPQQCSRPALAEEIEGMVEPLGGSLSFGSEVWCQNCSELHVGSSLSKFFIQAAKIFSGYESRPPVRGACSRPGLLFTEPDFWPVGLDLKCWYGDHHDTWEFQGDFKGWRKDQGSRGWVSRSGS